MLDMTLRILVSFVLIAVMMGAGPTAATAPYTSIIIDSGSPYFVPKSATVSSGSLVRWENPTPTEHTITHTGCMEDGASCAFDSGLVLPNDSFTIEGLAPGKYPYICRVHPIMFGILTVTDSQQPSQL